MKRIISLTLAAGLFLSSCNMPGASASDPQIATAAALTVQAALNTSPNSQPLASATAAGAGSIEVTPTYSQPMASVGEATNCRTGPGVNYERVTQILPSDSVEIVGFFPPNYWIVSTKDGECWVSGEFTTPIGSYTTVPTVATAPTLSGSSLDKISIQSYDYECNYETNEATVTIIWADKDGESGYRILRNGDVIAELPENSTVFKETINLLASQSAGYNVLVFSPGDSITSATVTISC